MSKPLKVLVVGCGNMGQSHARAYHGLDGFELAGLVSRQPSGRENLAAQLGFTGPLFSSFDEAMQAGAYDVVSINTYPDTHEAYALAALEQGAHVFLEKPIATTVEGAQRVVDCARQNHRKLVVGYILRQHPSWITFIEIAQSLGKPLVMRMNLNQQSSGDNWQTHKQLMKSMSPIIDCGVHYVDVMCQMTRSRPVSVSAIGARLTEEIDEGMYNYGQLQVRFEDGSCGWYEAGWGPMMSETAFFVKDVVGPKGCVSIAAVKASSESQSDNVDAHTKTEALKVHYSDLDANRQFAREDEIIAMQDEPDHDELCKREQQYLLKAIQEDLDLGNHMDDAVNSLRIVMAADESFRTGRTVDL
jgi:predicted dehydrogenase